MNQKHIGIVLMLVSVLAFILILSAQNRESVYISKLAEQSGSCFSEDGTCLHQQNVNSFIPAWAVSAVLLVLGIYLAFFDNTQKVIQEHQIKVAGAVESAMKHEREKDEFRAYLAGFSDEEQKVLASVKDQEGITQSTLRFKTGISKTQLSLILKSLEERKVLTRKESGKTKEVYLIKKF